MQITELEPKKVFKYFAEIAAIPHGSGNAAKLMGRLLEHLSHKLNIGVLDIAGGSKTNAIPKIWWANICIDKDKADLLRETAADFEKIIKKDSISTEPDITITVTEAELGEKQTDAESTRKLIFALLQIPNGVQAMSPDIPNLVQTSLNLGVLTMSDDALQMVVFIRSNASTGKQLTVQKLNSFIVYLDGHVRFESDYPAWEYKAESPLRPSQDY